MTQRWDSEADAGAVILSRIGGDLVPIDPGGGAQQLRDFDIHQADGKVIAVEVTRHNDREQHKRHAAVSQREWKFAELHFDWVVDMIPVLRRAHSASDGWQVAH